MSTTPVTVRLLLGISVMALTAYAVIGSGVLAPDLPQAVEAPIEFTEPTLDPERLPSSTLAAADEGEAASPQLQPIGGATVGAAEDDLEATTTTAAPATTASPAPPTTKANSGGKSPTTTAPKPTTTAPPASGNLKASGPVTIQGKSGVVIENLSISNPNGACVRIVGASNVTIRNSEIGPCGDWAVFIDKSSGVTVQGNTIRTNSSKGGVYGHSSTGIAVLGNSITHSGRNPVQFDKVTGAGNRIESNTIANNASEDMISVYKSGGTSGSWLKITKNKVRNNTGKSNSGSGIMLGDAGGSFILVQSNTLSDPGQAGIGVAGGSNIRVLNNRVESAAHPWSNVGIYVWDQYDSNCHAIEVRGNSVDWLNKNGQRNSAWNGGGCGEIAGWDDNDW